MKRLTVFAYLIMAIALCATILLNLPIKYSSFKAFLLFSVWLIAPYVAMSAALFYVQKSKLASPYWAALAMMVSVGGLLFLLDVMYWHPDAQGAIALMMTPILQGILAALLVPIVLWLSSRRHL